MDNEGIADERTAIRKELSAMSLGDIMKLKQRLGTKVYDEAMFGCTTSARKKSARTTPFKRVNKHRPREMSSKIPVTPVEFKTSVNHPQNRDPRFDSLCGTFDEKVFRKAYKFVDGIKGLELNELREELRNETDAKRQADISYLVQRMENQERERRRREERERQEKEQKQERIDALHSGQKPHFPTKAERRAKQLVTRYEELKKSGRLQKHLEKKRKKYVHKERKNLSILS